MSKAFHSAIARYGSAANRRAFLSSVDDPPPRTMAFVDCDNLLFKDDPGQAHAILCLDKFAVVLNANHVQATWCFRHFASAAEKKVWARYGCALTEVRANVDDTLIRKAAAYIVRGGLDKIIIMGGDGIYCCLAELARAHGIEMEVWARAGRISRRLAAIVKKTKVIDDLIYVPMALTGRTANESYISTQSTLIAA